MNERIDDLILLASLGELTDAEQAELDRAAAADPAVAAELDAQLAVAAELHATSDEELPPSLRASVLAAIATTPQDTALPAAPLVDLATVRERRTKRRMPLLAAAAAVILVAVGSFLVVRPGDSTDPVAAVVSADDAVVRMLDGELPGTLNVVFSRSEGAIVVDGDGLPALPSDRQYVLWFVVQAADGPLFDSVGGFQPDADGQVELRLDDLDPTDVTLGITNEPAGQLGDMPTGDILALS